MGANNRPAIYTDSVYSAMPIEMWEALAHEAKRSGVPANEIALRALHALLKGGAYGAKGDPVYEKTIHIRVTPRMKDDVYEAITELGIGESVLARRAIRRYLCELSEGKK